MDEYHHRFIVHPTGKDDLAYIGWEVATEEAMAAMGEQLRRAGVAVRAGAADEAEARSVAGLIEFADPSGIPSEIFYGPLVIFEKPFQSPPAIAGFKTGEQGLGHFVVSVSDFDRSLNISTATSWACASATS
jgi:biphenyl-2,3-diol 1,2-dioxygenase